MKDLSPVTVTCAAVQRYRKGEFFRCTMYLCGSVKHEYYRVVEATPNRAVCRRVSILRYWWNLAVIQTKRRFWELWNS